MKRRLLSRLRSDTKIEVKKWNYSRPPYIPEGQTEFLHPCGCKEYEEDGVWYLTQCTRHKIETDILIGRIKEHLEPKK